MNTTKHTFKQASLGVDISYMQNIVVLKTVTCRYMKCIKFKLRLKAEHIISIKELIT